MGAGVGVQATDTVNDGSQAAVQAAAGCGDGIAVAQRNTGHRQVNVAVDLTFAAMVDGRIAASVTTAFPAKIEIHIKSGFIAAGAAMCFVLAVVLALLCGLVVRLVRLWGRRRSRIRVRGRGGGFRHGRRLRHSRRFGGFRGFLRFFGRLRGGHQLNGAVDVAIAGPVGAAVAAAIDRTLPGQFGQVGNVDGLGADIKPVDRLIDQGIHGFARAVHPAGQVIQLAGQLTGRS